MPRHMTKQVTADCMQSSLERLATPPPNPFVCHKKQVLPTCGALQTANKMMVQLYGMAEQQNGFACNVNAAEPSIWSTQVSQRNRLDQGAQEH